MSAAAAEAQTEEGKYLLYIDILGFSEKVENEPAAIPNLYRIIDELNVHRHSGFRTIVFSDTIIVYNDFVPLTAHDHRYAVMFSCEFAQDLLHRLAGTGLHFRAILDYGPFVHQRLKNIESFFGQGLIAVYRQEQALPAVGLFITSSCNSYNDIFPTAAFKDDLSFVFLHQSLARLQMATGGHLPTDSFELSNTDDYWDILWDLSFLASIFRASRIHPDVRVRAKHLATYDLYRQRYPGILMALEDADFQPECICKSFDWSDMKRRFVEEVESGGRPSAPQTGSSE